MALATDLGTFRDKIQTPSLQSLQARPGAVFRPGALVAHRQGSKLLEVPLAASARTDLIICGTYVGRSKFTAAATYDVGGGAVDADGNPQMVQFEAGATGWFATGTAGNEVKDIHKDQLAYAHDDDTVYATDETNTTSPAGRVLGVAPVGHPHAGRIGIYIPNVPNDWAFEDGADAVASFTALLAGTANGEGAALVGIEDANLNFAGATAEAALADIGARIHLKVADATALVAIPASARADGQLVTKVDDDTVWTFDAASSEGASDWVKAPDAGTGRWVRRMASRLDLSSTATGKGASLVGLYDAGGLYTAADLEAALLELKTQAPYRKVRGIVFANVANLAAFAVTGNAYDDGLTYVEGDLVLLAAQTTAAQNGIYVVGAVSGTAALTRAADMPTGLVLAPDCRILVSEGTIYGGSEWRSTRTTAATIGTHDPVFYPRQYKQTITLAGGTYKVGFGSTATPDEPLFLLAGAAITFNVNTAGTAGGAPTLTTEYGCPAATRTAGGPGVGFFVVNAQVAAGTLNNADTSTLDVLVTNF